MSPFLKYGVGATASLLVVAASFWGYLPEELGSSLEVLGVVTGVWSVWLLSKNNPAGWWIGLVMVTAYAIVFYRVQLYAEVGIQIFYFATSLQAIHLWLRGGSQGIERRVSRASPTWIRVSALMVVVSVLILHRVLNDMRGAVPFWDALTTVLSLAAHIYLMWRLVESWYLWIAVDLIYVPLYASRHLYLTSALYFGFLVLAMYGLSNFRKELAAHEPETPIRPDQETAS